MQPALRELLTGLIDYAGLFPPAKLPLDAAVRNYLKYRAGPDAWMLGRFVIQAAKLHELTDIGAGMSISALGRGGADKASFAEGLKADIADIERCRQRFGGRVVIDVLETKPPDVMVDIAPAQAAGLRVFLEQPAGRVPREPPGAGLKIRTGGLEAAAFPPCDALAMSLAWAVASSERRVPFKATAGLHHPFPLMDAKIGAKMHGFVNVFVAGLMLSRLDFSEADAEELLSSPAGDFTLSDAGMSWRGRRPLGADDIRGGRKLMTSFGSCSFDEPRDDLRALGWM